MKKYGLVGLLVLLAFALIQPAYVKAEKQSPTTMIPMVDESGKIVMIEKAPAPLRQPTIEEKQAINNPGQKVPIIDHQSLFKRVDFWHIAFIQTYNTAVIFQDGQLKTITETGQIKSKPIFAFYVLFGLLAIILMVISNVIICYKGITDDDAAALIAVAFVAAAVAFVVAAVAAAAWAAVAAWVAMVATTIVDNEDKKVYWIASIMFYVFMMAVLII